MPDVSTSSPDAIGVLICDDVAAMRVLLRILVELDTGLQVAGEARNGVEAVAQAGLLQPDVILLDLSMPVLSGLVALPRITEAAPAARVIAFTSLSDPVIESAVLDAGAHRFLEKGVTPEEITQAIRDTHGAVGSALARAR